MYTKPVFVPKIKKISKRSISDLTNIYNIELYHPFSPEVLLDDGDYIISDCPVDGLSENGFGADDIILVNRKAELKPGDIVLVFYETISLLRRYYPESDGTITLKADTRVIDKENFAPEEITIVGKVEGRYTRF